MHWALRLLFIVPGQTFTLWGVAIEAFADFPAQAAFFYHLLYYIGASRQFTRA
jgi:hypothetical protein